MNFFGVIERAAAPFLATRRQNRGMIVSNNR
jgi:hypothetical protein